VVEERTHVWSAQPRIAVFLAVTRHSTQGLRAAGRTLHCTRLGASCANATTC
jgi:deoxyribodipyrimidine photolyase-related protein